MPFMILRRVKDNPRSTWVPVSRDQFATKDGETGTDAWIANRVETGPAHLEYTAVEVPA
jgi:hypothetical protein